MPSYIFLSNKLTYPECKKKNLFGGKDKRQLAIQTGDHCFLYCYDGDNSFIEGVFVAASDGRENIDSGAWKNDRRRPFPNQVQVNNKDPQGTITISSKDEDIAKIIFENNGGVKPILNDSEANKLRQIFDRKCKPMMIESDIGIKKIEAIEDYRDKFPTDFRCTDGHRVRSLSEQTIDQWLSSRRIFHEYERLVEFGENPIIPDFTLYDRSGHPVYLEFYGMLDIPQYKSKAEWKRNVYRKNNCKVIEIIQEDLKNLDHHMINKLRAENINLQ